MRSKIFLILFSFILINVSTPGLAAIRTVTGTVTKVSDGDTSHITTPEQTKLRVRFYGIDAPETPKIDADSGHVNMPGQPFGVESWRALEAKIMGKKVKADILDIDKYRRMVCMIYLDDRNVNLEMVREGYAEAFLEYLKPPYREEFLAAQRGAQSARKGIWSLPNYERPRAFRKRLKFEAGELIKI